MGRGASGAVTSSPLSDAAARFRTGPLPDTPLMRATDFGRRVRVEARGIPEYHPPLFPEEGFAYWMAVIRDRVRHNFDAVVIISGDEGLGKSSLALRMAEVLDPTFQVGRICYTSKDVLSRFRDTEKGRVIIYDEAARSLLGANSNTPEAKSLAMALMLVREKGLITILNIPRIRELAPSMRARRATLWFYIPQRGIARVHERVSRPGYKDDTNDLGLFISKRAPILLWKAYSPSSKMWKAYLAHKTMKLNEFLAEAEAIASRRQGKKEVDADGEARTVTKSSGAERTRRWRERKAAKEASP